MRQTKIRPMVEGGFLAAMAIIVAVISAYLPLVGPFINLLWPVPIILLGVRHGYKWSMLATVVAGLIIAMLVQPLEAVTVVIGFGLIGIVLGHAFRMEFGPGKTILWGTIASLLSKVALLGIGIASTGINPFDMQGDAMAQMINQTIEIYRNFGIPEDKITELTTNLNTIIKFVEIAFPSAFILGSIVDTFVNFLIAKVVLKKLGHTIADFPPFKHWTLPSYIVYFFAVGLVMIYWGQSREITLLYNSGINLYMLASTILLVQGLSLFNYVVDKYNLSRWTRSIILVLILTNGLLAQMVICAGAIDTIIDYRRLRTTNSKKID